MDDLLSIVGIVVIGWVGLFTVAALNLSVGVGVPIAVVWACGAGWFGARALVRRDGDDH